MLSKYAEEMKNMNMFGFAGGLEECVEFLKRKESEENGRP